MIQKVLRIYLENSDPTSALLAEIAHSSFSEVHVWFNILCTIDCLTSKSFVS